MLKPQPRKEQITSNPRVETSGRSQPIISTKQATLQKAEFERFQAFPSKVTVWNWQPALTLAPLDLIALPIEISPFEDPSNWVVTTISLSFYLEGFKAELQLNKPGTADSLGASTPAIPGTTSDSIPITGEKWGNPLPGYNCISAYGFRPATNSWHVGLDFAAPEGIPVLATMSGTVSKAGWYSGYGNTVDILHNLDGEQFLSRYGHGSKVLVKEGQKVKKGDKILLVGNTGKSFGSHLHFEIRSATNLFRQPGSLNPYLLIGGIPGEPGSVGSFTKQHSAGAASGKVAEKYRS